MIKRLPSTKELQAFLVTAELLNFTAAAQVLNVTQGAISRQIMSLEQQLKVRLFQRHARGLTLTSKGNELLPLIEQALNLLNRAVEQICSDKQQIKLKAPSCITPWLLPKLMAFEQHYPDIDVELTSAIKHNVNFATEPFDAAICYGPAPQNKSLLTQLLFEERLTPVCAPSLLPDAKSPLSTNQLQSKTWLHATPQKSDWMLWLKQAQRPELLADHNQHFATLDLAVNAAVQGFGIAIGDVTLAQADLAAGRLVTPHPLTITSGNSYYVVQPKSLKAPNLQLLIDWILQP
ncbi:MAG: LysR family transcriptional regulator [Gammaproteobacteria bacterium]|nr:LysR family transcriptional regulator [Gammaproteobacteria bacterium]